MNPLIPFAILVALNAFTFRRFADRMLVRVIGFSTLLLAVPAISLSSGAVAWHAYSTQPTLAVTVLCVIGGVGAALLVACCLLAVSRLVLPARTELGRHARTELGRHAVVVVDKEKLVK